MADFQVTIIGAGVVGLAIAAKLSQKSRQVLLVEKNTKYGMETSSRNSEVIHAGIYYQPGSLKAVLCVEGRDKVYEICRDHSIPHRQTTKIITATSPDELEKLEKISTNGKANGVELKMLSREETLKLEPNINTVGSIFSPLTGIVSAHGLMDYFYHEAIENGVTVQHRCEVVSIAKTPEGYAVTLQEGAEASTIVSEIVVNAAGLHSDKIAAMAGIQIDEAGYRLSYAKGSYFAVTPSKANLVSRLVYPVPQNEGIGVHALIDWGGRLKFGPDVEYLPDGMLDYSVSESKTHLFGESIRRILPQITDADITPDMSGIRPKLQRKGEPFKDFVITHEKERGLEGLINLIGIESPGLTCSPAIARYVEELL